MRYCLNVFNAIVLPIFDYCDAPWSNLLQQDKDQMEGLQCRAAQVIVGGSVDLLDALKLKWVSLHDRRSYHKVLLVFKCLHDIVPELLANHFSRQCSVNKYNVRRNDSITLPK